MLALSKDNSSLLFDCIINNFETEILTTNWGFTLKSI